MFFDIGAGNGVLSARLAERVERLLAVEIDADCIPLLEKALATSESAIILSADILKLNLAELVSRYRKPGQKIRIAGNLPYNIATSIIEKLFRCGLLIEDMFFMVQREVAQRIASSPGSRQYGYFSVYCQHHATVQMGFRVSSACFVPRPKVESAMISLHPKAGPRDPVFESAFETLCKAAFSYRRKTLENSLEKNPLLRNSARDLLNQAGIDGSRRAEALTVEEYEHLAQVFLSNFRS